MNRPTFQKNTKVKVICKKMPSFYGKRGYVAKIFVNIDGREYDSIADKDAIKAAYAEGKEAEMVWHVCVKFPESEIEDGSFLNSTTEYQFEPEDIEPVQKKFIDIENLREHDEVIGQKEDGTDIIRKSNAGEFDVSDIIQITTKIDGANASIAWDETTQKLEIFSRENLLDASNSLKGFYDYIKTQVEPKTDWSQFKNLVFFGEWCIKHTIKYNNDWYGKWRVYDVWDKNHGRYLDQISVLALCNIIGLEYIEELYYGPFVSWEHCRSFMNKSTAYGPDQEGIVVKNQAALFRSENRFPAYLKIVNESFKETMKVKQPKEIDPEAMALRQRNIELANSIVTEARIKKMILKLIDEGLIPENLTPKDMGLVMKHLPKRIYDDVLKEEMETVKAIGESASKIISGCVAQLARKIIIGN